LAKLCKNQLERFYAPLQQALADSDGLTAYCRSTVEERLSADRQRLATRRDEDLKRAETNHAKAIAAAEAHRDERLRQINEIYATKMVEIQTAQQRGLRDAIDAHDHLIDKLQAQSEAKFRKKQEKYEAVKEQIRTEYQTAWRSMADHWRT